MADLVIKPTSGNLIIKDDQNVARLTIAPTSGATTLSNVTAGTLGSGITFPDGHILQVKSTTVTDTPSITSSSQWLDWTGLSVSITPSSASNKIFITASINVSTASDSAQRLVRGSTPICIGNASASRRQATSGGNIHRGDHEMCQFSVNYLDSPNTTSATTYKMQGIDETSETQWLNRERTDGDEASDSIGASTITVMEVKA
jgi:hypothetical protein